MSEQKKSTKENDKIEFLEQRIQDAHSFFKHTLSAITIIFIFVGIIITVLSIVSKNEVSNAIQDMKNDFEKLSNQALRIPLIDIYSEGERIDNRTLYVKLDKNDFDLSNIYVKNHGDGITKFISVKLYISNDITARPSEWWEKQTSFDENYKSLIYWGAQVPVSPGESWNLPVIKGKLKDQNITQLECKIEIFYGGNKPALSKFIVSFKK